ncbi:Rcs stress response system protein RcsF [Tatumella sp. TA1]|uniref:Rcs stress response system protein RcsF n=1 Tax=Rosenbergiella collisarenosi TaxID=1544695 RepID=UPI0008F91654|nr:Rcs stress response system protein RcsF [Rosenbergiella collisarenosi]MBT0720175.1 Rcs stress response system protein RcsF [Rosenbergiella collisarenosi]QGX92189.1 Rcs stress response system protein RcsF [Tatumella sp. TA1]
MRLRLLPLCMIIVGIAGCATKYKPVEPFPKKNQAQTEEKVRKPIHRATPVQLYTNPTDLINKPFRDLGEVSGEDCQASAQSSPPNLNTARKRMQMKASNLKANAILVHQCEVIATNAGCYREAVCQGSALKITQ